MLCLARALETNKPTWPALCLYDVASILGRRRCGRTSSLFERRRHVSTVRAVLGDIGPRTRSRNATDPPRQLAANNRRRKDLFTLPQADKALLELIGYRRKLKEIDESILANAQFLHKIVANPEIFGHDVDAVAGEDGGVTLEDSERPSGGRTIRSAHRICRLSHRRRFFQNTARKVTPTV